MSKFVLLWIIRCSVRLTTGRGGLRRLAVFHGRQFGDPRLVLTTLLDCDCIGCDQVVGIVEGWFETTSISLHWFAFV